jgi:hypothetical protein
VSAFPAAMPATCVPWLESLSAHGSLALEACALAGGNTLAAMTFALVKRRWPLGKPAGMA